MIGDLLARPAPELAGQLEWAMPWRQGLLRWPERRRYSTIKQVVTVVKRILHRGVRGCLLESEGPAGT